MFYPLVSVIIPVYQAEKFLTECVESVRKQDYSELEIVLVNDGSTDRSNQMCEDLAAAVIWKKKTRTAQSSGFMDFFKKERFLTTGENSTANLFWSLTICGFPHTVTPKTRHIILDAVHAIRNMLLSHRASFFTVKISSP